MTIEEAIQSFARHSYEPENPLHNTSADGPWTAHRAELKEASRVRRQALMDGTWPGDPAPAAKPAKKA